MTMSRTAKLSTAAAGLVILGGTAMLGNGLAAQFSSTTNSTTVVDTAKISVGDFTGGAADPNSPASGEFALTSEVRNLWPGDTAYRFFDVENTGSLPIGQLQLFSSVNGQLADLPAPTKTYASQIPNEETQVVGTGGKPVTMTLQGCSVPWSYDGSSAPTCSGTVYRYYSNKSSKTVNETSTLLYSVVSSNNGTIVPVTSGASYVNPYGMPKGLESTKKIHMLSSFTLPMDSTNEYQGTSMTVKWSLIAKPTP